MADNFDWQESVPLKNWTTFKIGGPARYFSRVKSEDNLREVLSRARDIGCPVFILGGGSNLLVPDCGYPGLIIQMGIDSVEWGERSVHVGSGVALSWLTREFVKRGLSGLEWEAAVPGTIGGAVFGNAGTPEHNIGHLVNRVDFIERAGMERDHYSPGQCCFGYRDSIFRHNPDKIITSVTLSIKPGEKKFVTNKYYELIASKELSQPRLQPSAGCVFKNPPEHSAGMLIDQVGLKGFKIGDAQVSEKHANFIVNLGKAKSQDVIDLIALIKDRVLAEKGIVLEEEIIHLTVRA